MGFGKVPITTFLKVRISMVLPKPYIGITGFMTEGEVQVIEECMPPEGLEKFLFMAGFLMSQKTLRGLTNKYPNKYPKRNAMPTLLSFEDQNTMNIIHYNTDDADTLPVQLMAMVGMFHDEESFVATLNGFQLNLAWPMPSLIKEFHDMADVKKQKFKIILQVGSKALEQIDQVPTVLAAKLKEYEGIVDYVLLDPSGGFGKPMDVAKMGTYLRAIWDTERSYGVGIAGGLSAESFDGEVAELLHAFGDVSIDAEGRLRDAQDNLDVQKAQDYFSRAVRLYTMLLR